MSKIYEIDPDADTLVVVRPLADSFAPWPAHDHNGASQASAAPAVPTADVRIKVSSKHLSLASPRFRDILAQKAAAAAAAASSAAASPVSSPARNGYKTPPASPGKSSLSGNSNSLWRKEAAAPPSPPLSNSGGSSYSQTEEADGRIHIVLEGLDADAVTTVLNIVHGRGGKDRVPKTVSLEALARIAAVVDKFKLHDAVEIYADRWVDAVGHPSAEKSSRRELTLWIYVAYVFQRDTLFREATKLAATQLTGPLPALANLPLRAKIAHDIDAQRQEVVGQALDVLEGAVGTLVASGSEGSEGSEEDDDANPADTLLLGALLRTLHRHKAIWPRPAAPYAGVSIAAIAGAVHEVQTQTWKTAYRLGESTRFNKTNNALKLTPQLDSLKASVAGLTLKSELGYNLY
ncbi:hypothetical protein SCUCBS95973_007881 [Sporothrix curviconia]|uniref:Uncharacterized protein n=1 Tax=Sporothrix curviconia TaxID=1260050 RepID=A0ABP0CJU1_9PEZI